MNLLVVLLTLIYYISIALIHQKAIAQQPGGSGSGSGSDWKTLLANAFKANCEPIDDDEQYRGWAQEFGTDGLLTADQFVVFANQRLKITNADRARNLFRKVMASDPRRIESTSEEKMDLLGIKCAHLVHNKIRF